MQLVHHLHSLVNRYPSRSIVQGCLLSVCLLALNSARAQDELTSANPKESTALNSIRLEWEASVRPILSTHCFPCHDSIEHSGRLDLETIASLLRGGLSGTLIETASPTDSLLLGVLQPDATQHMPPEGQLNDEEIGAIERWLALFSEPGSEHFWQPDTRKFQSEANVAVEHASRNDLCNSLPLGLDASKVIDLAIEQAWNEHAIQATPITEDAIFARRVYLDLIGRIPSQSELSKFVAANDSRKRDHLVDAILASPEHAVHMAEVLDALFIGRTNAKQYEQRQHAGWFEYLQRAIGDNRPWNRVAEEIVLARPQSEEENGATWYLYARQDKHQDIAEAVSKDFFGVRIDCAQCHDHPLAAEIEQRHYWGLVAFFNRSKNVDTPQGPRVGESAIGGFSEFANLSGKSSLNELVFLGVPVVEETRPAPDANIEDREELYRTPSPGNPKIPHFSRREQFTEHVLRDHPLVAKAMVNRMWGWMMGRGLVHPIDALDSYHPASHPALLDWLSRDFVDSNYDLRRLLRNLALSQTYQRAAAAHPQQDPKWFSSALAKPLTAETLYRSFQVALDLDNPSAWNSTAKRTEFARQFPDVLAEESLANVSQGLLLTNGELLQDMISSKQSRTVRAAAEMPEPQQAVEALFQAILGRRPDEAELHRCSDFVKSRSAGPSTAVEGLAWALITSAEFRFSH